MSASLVLHAHAGEVTGWIAYYCFLLVWFDFMCMVWYVYLYVYMDVPFDSLVCFHFFPFGYCGDCCCPNYKSTCSFILVACCCCNNNQIDGRFAYVNVWCLLLLCQSLASPQTQSQSQSFMLQSFNRFIVKIVSRYFSIVFCCMFLFSCHRMKIKLSFFLPSSF